MVLWYGKHSLQYHVDLVAVVAGSVNMKSGLCDTADLYQINKKHRSPVIGNDKAGSPGKSSLAVIKP